MSEATTNVGHQTVTHVQPAPLVPDDRGRTDHPSAGCPVETALEAISGRWTSLILRDLMAGGLSFGQLRAAFPTLSAKVLADRLRDLQDRGLVRRQRLAGFPTRTNYQLTAAGYGLRPLLGALYAAGDHVQRTRVTTAGSAASGSATEGRGPAPRA